MSSLIIKAKHFATAAHNGQFRKYHENVPYIVHPVRVAGRVLGHTIASDTTVSVALLHDVIEDCEGYDWNAIAYIFGEKIANMVGELTNSSPKHLPRAKRKEMDRLRLQNVSHEAKVIKLIDRIDNLADMYASGDPDFRRQYAKESLFLLEALVNTDTTLQWELKELAQTLML